MPNMTIRSITPASEYNDIYVRFPLCLTPASRACASQNLPVSIDESWCLAVLPRFACARLRQHAVRTVRVTAMVLYATRRIRFSCMTRRPDIGFVVAPNNSYCGGVRGGCWRFRVCRIPWGRYP